jgi:hypothetical protein
MGEGTVRFNASLPKPYNENWRKAYSVEKSDCSRIASYQPPGGGAVPFIQKSFRFASGQSKDTSEYPFGRLWSNTYLNEKPQTLTVEGYLRGPDYIAARNNMIEALRIPTHDANPGYIDLPFWGRFPVVVNDTYEIAEAADEQGQCTISISFTRAATNVSEPWVARFINVDELYKAATARRRGGFDVRTLRGAAGKVRNLLLRTLGAFHRTQTVLNSINREISGLMSLTSSLILAPLQFAQALFNIGDLYASGIAEIRNSFAAWGNFANKEKRVLIDFLSADSAVLSDEEPATPAQQATLKECENLFRIMAFSVSARIMDDMELTYESASGYWRLLEKLIDSIDCENPELYAAIQDIRSALAHNISAREISRELTRNIAHATPLLCLAHSLGCDETKLRELNSIADSFVVEGDVIYV